jgi:hypothetical protein
MNCTHPNISRVNDPKHPEIDPPYKCLFCGWELDVDGTEWRPPK